MQHSDGTGDTELTPAGVLARNMERPLSRLFAKVGEAHLSFMLEVNLSKTKQHLVMGTI